MRRTHVIHRHVKKVSAMTNTIMKLCPGKHNSSWSFPLPSPPVADSLLGISSEGAVMPQPANALGPSGWCRARGV